MQTKKNMITGSGGGKSGGEVFVRQPDTIRSTATARLLVALSAGPVEGLQTATARDGSNASILFDGAPLPSATTGSNGAGPVEWQMTNGAGNQDPVSLKGFNAVENTVTIGAKLAHNAAWERQAPQGGTRYDAARLTLRFPSGLVRRSDVGIFGTTVRLKIERAVRRSGNRIDWQTVSEPVISEKQTAFFELQYLVDLTGGQDGFTQRVRVTRLTEDAPLSGGDLYNQVNIQSVSWITWDRLSYAGISVLALRIGADSFAGRVPRLAVDLKGRHIKVPDNYNPVTRAYDGIWGGGFSIAFSNNPAWVLYDLLTDREWGLGIDEGLIEKNDLYAIARYADQEVPDGKTGSGREPRFLFDGVIARRVPAAQLVGQICAGMRVSYFWSGGRMRFIQDRRAEPVLWLTNYHVEGGRFIYSGPSAEATWSHALVSFNDTASPNGVSVEAESNSAILRDFGYRAREVALLGCTRRSQARRHARWLLASSALALHGVSWYASLDHIAENPVRPGDVVRINDTERLGSKDIPGRIHASTGNTITAGLDMEPTATARGAVLDYESADGWKKGIEVTVVASATGGRQTASITRKAGNWSHTPADGGAMLLHLSATVAQAAKRGGEDYRIIAVRERDNHRLEISAIRYDDGLYEAIENGLSVDDDAATGEAAGAIPGASGIEIRQPTQAIAGNVGGRDIHVGWTAPNDARIARWRVVATGPDGEAAQAETARPPAILSGLVAGAWRFEITAIDWGGRESAPVGAAFTVRAVALRRGAVITKGTVTRKQWSNAAANAAIKTLTEVAPVPGDVVTLSFTGTDAADNWAETRQFDGTVWAVAPALISGDTLADASVPASRLQSVNAGIISGGAIRSTGYAPGSRGFNIDMDGSAEFNDAVIRGELDGAEIYSGLLAASTVVITTQEKWQQDRAEPPANATPHRFLTHDTPRKLRFHRIDTSFEGTRVNRNAQNIVKFGEIQVAWDSHTTRINDRNNRIIAADDPRGDNTAGTRNSYYSRFWKRAPVFEVHMNYEKTLAQYRRASQTPPWGRYAGKDSRFRVRITTTSGRTVADSGKIYIGRDLVGGDRPTWKVPQNDDTVQTILPLYRNFAVGSVLSTTRTTAWERPQNTGSARGRSFTKGLAITAHVAADLSHEEATRLRNKAITDRASSVPPAPGRNDGFFVEFWFDFTNEALTHDAVLAFHTSLNLKGTTLE